MAAVIGAGYKPAMRYSLTVVLGTALALLSSPASATLPDLCDDVWLDPNGSPLEDSTGFQLSRFCSWTNELDVTAWTGVVCCTIGSSSATCTPATPTGRCLSGARYSCEFAWQDAAGQVHCEQPWRDACAEGFCSSVLPPGATPMPAEPLCCLAADNCYVVDPGDLSSCSGQFVVCAAPFCNADGSVGCADDE